MSSNLDPNTDLDRPQIDNGPGTSGIQDKKKNKKEVKLFLVPQTKIYPHLPLGRGDSMIFGYHVPPLPSSQVSIFRNFSELLLTILYRYHIQCSPSPLASGGTWNPKIIESPLPPPQITLRRGWIGLFSGSKRGEPSWDVVIWWRKWSFWRHKNWFSILIHYERIFYLVPRGYFSHDNISSIYHAP